MYLNILVTVFNAVLFENRKSECSWKNSAKKIANTRKMIQLSLQFYPTEAREMVRYTYYSKRNRLSQLCPTIFMIDLYRTLMGPIRELGVRQIVAKVLVQFKLFV